MISRDNYETWIIDYLDGKLTTDQVGQLILFLEMNPDIAEEFDGLDEVKLEDSNPIFSGKESLLREPMDLPMEEVDMLLVKKLEGDLNEEEEKAVNAMINSHEWISRSWAILQKTQVNQTSEEFVDKESLLFPDHVDLTNEEMALVAVAEGDLAISELDNIENAEQRIGLYSKLRVTSDETVAFKGKEDLIQKGAVVKFRPWLIRTAAAAAVLLLLWQTWTTTSPSDAMSVVGFSNVVNVKNVEGSDIQSDDRQLIEKQEQIYEAQPNYVAQNVAQHPEVTPSFEKVSAPVSLALLKAGPFDVSLPQPVLTVVELPEIEPILYAELHDEPIIPAVDEVPTALEFIGTKIKQKLWGGDDIPEDDFGLALAGKAAEKYSARTGADVALANNEDEKGGFSLRLGKLEISRY